MTSFDLDDPLGDLLSDGSNDSFFDDPKPSSKRASLTKSPEKKSINELFGLEEKSTEVRTNKTDYWLGLDSKSKSVDPTAAPRYQDKPQKKISFEDDDDIMHTLGLDAATKPKQESLGRGDTKKIDQAKKTSLMESILGPTKDNDKKFSSLDDLLKDSKFSKKPMPVEISQSTSQIPQKMDLQPNYGMSSLDSTREGRRPRPKTSGIADPLGLFSEPTPTEIITPSVITRPRTMQSSTIEKNKDIEVLYQAKDLKTSASDTSEIPDWLGGGPGSAKISKSDNTEKVQKIEKLPSRRNSLTPNAAIQEIHNLPEIAEPVIPQSINIESLMTQQKLATSHMEYQNTSIALQQQESQLLVALQLRKYEDNLSDMQRKQQDILIKQEQQFNNLLERQFTKQTIMENNMRMQQDRINNHIQMLISQPPISQHASHESFEKLDELKKNNSEEIIKQYEDMITNLKQRHLDEIFLLEESYKKQISTLEQSMESVENHLKSELDTISLKHKEKIGQEQDEHEAEIIKYKNKIEEIYTHHASELKQMRENHNRVIEEIKYEQNVVIENIKQSKQSESNLLEDSRLYSQKLDHSAKLMEINSHSLLELKEKVVKDYGILSQAREESLRAKEDEIKLMRLALEKSREIADDERAQLMSLVRNLEIKLAEQSQNSREERFALQQAASTLTARSSALDREAEFNRSSLERERDQLKTLRETLLAEQGKSMLQLTEEKLALQAERMRIETSSKLTHSYDSQRAQAEMEAVMQVANEVTELTDREREKLHRQQREIEILKRNLTDRERKLHLRERDVESITHAADQKFKDGERALEEANLVHSNYNERIREIQIQLVSLTNREKRLAEEKISLSKERVALHNSSKYKKCSLCAIDNVPRIDEDIPETVEHDIPRFMESDIPRFASTSDADMFRLQLQISEDQLTSSHADDRISIN